MWRSVSADWFLSVQEPLLGLSGKASILMHFSLALPSFGLRKAWLFFKKHVLRVHSFPVHLLFHLKFLLQRCENMVKHTNAAYFKLCSTVLCWMQGGVPGALWFLQTDIIAPQWCSVAYVVWYMTPVKSSKSRGIVALSKPGAISFFLL